MLEFLAIPFLLYLSFTKVVSPDDFSSFPEPEYSYHSISSDRPKSSLSILKVPHTSDTTVGDERYALMLGNVFPLFESRYSSYSLYYSFGGGLYHQFDLTRGIDGVGYNGSILSTLTASFTYFDFDLTVKHLSGHLSDEYVENTGQKRLSYARNEYLMAMRYHRSPFSNHFEVAYDYSHNKAAPHDPWRLRNEVQYYFLSLNQWRPYLAIDLDARQEREWRIDQSLQLGVSVWKEKREKFRIYLEAYQGGSRLTEFFRENEKMLSLGLVLY